MLFCVVIWCYFVLSLDVILCSGEHLRKSSNKGLQIKVLVIINHLLLLRNINHLLFLRNINHLLLLRYIKHL